MFLDHGLLRIINMFVGDNIGIESILQIEFVLHIIIKLSLIPDLNGGVISGMLLLGLLGFLDLLDQIKHFFNLLVAQYVFQFLSQMVIELGRVRVWPRQFLDLLVLVKGVVPTRHRFLQAPEFIIANKLALSELFLCACHRIALGPLASSQRRPPINPKIN